MGRPPTPARLHAAMRDSVEAGGKRLRPILCRACAEAAGGTADALIETDRFIVSRPC